MNLHGDELGRGRILRQHAHHHHRVAHCQHAGRGERGGAQGRVRQRAEAHGGQGARGHVRPAARGQSAHGRGVHRHGRGAGRNDEVVLRQLNDRRERARCGGEGGQLGCGKSAHSTGQTRVSTISSNCHTQSKFISTAAMHVPWSLMRLTRIWIHGGSERGLLRSNLDREERVAVRQRDARAQLARGGAGVRVGRRGVEAAQRVARAQHREQVGADRRDCERLRHTGGQRQRVDLPARN